MAIKVNTNLEAINVLNNLTISSSKVANSMRRLSSGKRINSAKDDASGLAVANGFRAKISSMRVASQNATEANSMLQVADGSYNKITDILVRMRDLSTQAASGQTTERDKLDTEYQALLGEIDRIANSTKYGDTNLTNAALTVTFQIGADNTGDDQLDVSFASVLATDLGVGGDLTSEANAQTAMDDIDTALDTMNTQMASIGAYQNRLQYTIENLAIGIENYSASESAIRDADMAFEMTMFISGQVLQQIGTAMLTHANNNMQMASQVVGR